MRWNRHEAHPRSRGENVGISLPEVVDWGSSPLTRGKHPSQQPLTGPRGLIPAHAGKTFPGPSGGCELGAHPRSRGENTPVGTPAPLVQGSSPLTRGKLRLLRAPAAAKGLIPAHAGKTYPEAVAEADPGAHPRSRGENPTLLITTPHVQGSSPLTRGKPAPVALAFFIAGLIPAHAGKTRAGAWSC